MPGVSSEMSEVWPAPGDIVEYDDLLNRQMQIFSKNKKNAYFSFSESSVSVYIMCI